MRPDAFPLTAPTTNGLFQFENPGTQPVSFTLTPNAFKLGAQLRSGETLATQTIGRPLTGLVGGDGKSYGGIYTAAELAPGQRAALSFLDAIQATPSQVKAASGIAEGNIALHYPGQSVAGIPNHSFILST